MWPGSFRIHSIRIALLPDLCLILSKSIFPFPSTLTVSSPSTWASDLNAGPFLWLMMVGCLQCLNLEIDLLQYFALPTWTGGNGSLLSGVRFPFVTLAQSEVQFNHRWLEFTVQLLDIVHFDSNLVLSTAVTWKAHEKTLYFRVAAHKNNNHLVTSV